MRTDEYRLRLLKRAHAAVLKARVDYSTADIVSAPITEKEMSAALAPVNLPGSLLREFRRWAPPEQREPAFHLLMGIWNAAKERRIERVVEVQLLGRSRDAYGHKERPGIISAGARVIDDLLRSVKEAVEWTESAEWLHTGALWCGDPVIHRVLERKCSFVTEALSSLRQTLPFLEVAQKALQRAFDAGTARRRRGRKKSTTLNLTFVSPHPLSRRQLERMLQNYLVLADGPSVRKAPNDLRVAARKLAHRLVAQTLSSADRFILKAPKQRRSSAGTGRREVQGDVDARPLGSTRPSTDDAVSDRGPSEAG